MSTGTIERQNPASALIANQIPSEPLLHGEILYEVVDNEIRELPPMSARETQFATDLARMIGNHVGRTSSGRAQAEMLFLIDESRNLQRRPDASYVSYERWPKGKPVPGTPAWEVVPDLAAEIVSPSNEAFEILQKLEEYFACGVKRVWVFYPPFSKVYDYTSTTSVRILTRADHLPGGEILPGLELPLSELFDDPGAAE
jgi:Uma2 family endonuclease